MTRIHEDKFAPGDIVTWRDEYFATLADGRKKFGDRITITRVVPVVRGFRHVGHTQNVFIKEDPLNAIWSGAFFRHLASWEIAA